LIYQFNDICAIGGRGVEVNSGLQTELEQSDQILTHVQNQEETKTIKQLLEVHNNENGSVKVERNKLVQN
jgi:hypothetical protein